MKTQSILFLLLLCGCCQWGNTQSALNLGLAYFGQDLQHPGATLELELEPFHASTFSLPFGIGLGYYADNDYQVVFLEFHKGFRKYFPGGLYLDQAIGLGLSSTFYQVEGIYYFDRFGNATSFREGANLSLMPSVSAGIGYDLTPERESGNYFWIRPKLFWNLAFRGLEFPYGAVQIGFSHSFKTHAK